VVQLLLVTRSVRAAHAWPQPWFENCNPVKNVMVSPPSALAGVKQLQLYLSVVDLNLPDDF